MVLKEGEPAKICCLVKLIGADSPVLRIAAMQLHSPIHTFQFNSEGKLVIANESAMRKYTAGQLPVISY